jgi:hypothetical protein
MIKRAQATLEFTLVSVIIIALLVSLVGLWKWSSDNIVRRQVKYNDSRVEAGSPESATPGEVSPASRFQASEITDQASMLE